MNRYQLIQYSLVILLAALVAGCGNARSFVHQSQPYGAETQASIAALPPVADAYLQQAEQLSSPQKEQFQLLAANLLLKARQSKEGQTIIQAIDPASLPANLRPMYHVVMARSASLSNRPKRVLAELAQVNYPDLLPLALQIDLMMLRIQAHEQLGERVNALRDRVYVDTLLNDDKAAQHNNRRALWRLLLTLNVRTLQSEANKQSNVYRGWIQLAQIGKQYENLPDQFNRALAQWQKQFPNHPASSMVTKNVTYDTDKSNIKPFAPNRIALLLPITGKLGQSGQAVRDGFLAAYYAQQQNDKARAQVVIYDTHDDQNATDAYDKARRDGSDLVIGPLSKAGVAKLHNNHTLSGPPIIALNYLEQRASRSGAYFYQMGLAPEDEARQAAIQAWQDGHMNAFILTPDTPWGHRLSDAFSDAWQARGGNILGQRYFSDKNLSNTIANLLDINASEERAKKLKRVLAQPFQFQARRRQDFDVIFLAATPAQARQINPFLAYYYAADVPLYAVSSLYTGQAQPEMDKDLNGTTFCDMPWVITPRASDIKLKQTMQTLWGDKAQRYTRFFALGIDAYDVIYQLHRLNVFPEFAFDGKIGQLTLDANNRLVRRLPCATFVNGKAKPLKRG